MERMRKRKRKRAGLNWNAYDYSFLEKNLGGIAPVEIVVAFTDEFSEAHGFLNRMELIRSVEALVSVVNEFMSPGDLRVSKITPRWVSRFRKKLRKAGRKETTIDSHCRHLKAMLRWGQTQGMVNEIPHMDISKRSKGARLMKGSSYR